jgi:hypothetical protein
MLFAKLNVDGLGTFAAPVGLGFERDTLAFIDGGKARALQGGNVKEYVLAAVVRRNEAEASRMIEKLDGPSLAHGKLSFPPSNLPAYQQRPRTIFVNSLDGESNHDPFKSIRG